MNSTQQRALRLLMEAELSHNEIHDALRRALRALHSKAWCWLQEIYDTHVVYDVNPKPDPAMPDEAEPPRARLFDVDYSVDEAGNVTLGTPVEVRKVVSYEPVATSAPAVEAAGEEFDLDFVPLIERAVRTDGSMPVKIIAPGWGSSGFYSPEVLMRDGPKVFTKGLHMYADHPTATEEAERPERSVKDLMATLTSDARYDPVGPIVPTAEGQKAAGPGLYADAKVVDGWKPMVEELAPHIGLSIRALGRAVRGEAEGRKGPIIEGIVAAKSVDLVTAAGAGGKILNLFESARARAQATITTGGEGDVDEKQLQEAQAARETAENELKEAKEKLARFEEAQLQEDATKFVGDTLPTAVEGIIPAVWQITRSRLAESLPAKAVVKDGALDKEATKTIIEAAVSAEVAYLAKLSESGTIKGMGAGASTGDHGDTTAQLEDSFRTLGLSESAAKTAASGR